jgi:hypothetical protein
MKETRPLPDDKEQERQSRCFEIGGKFQLVHPKWVLVHAEVCPKGESFADHKYPYCFCEMGNEIYDPVLDHIFNRDSYFEKYQVMNERKYNSKTALEKMWKSNRWGPW